MSHIHLPDGILPAWLWLSGYVLTALLIAILWRGGEATAEPHRFARLGIFAAIMTLAMAVEIPPVGFHLNISVVTGIILKPRMAVLAALIVNLLLALIGHGGITVAGLNTLVLSTEMVVGYYAFGFLRHRMHASVSRAGFASTVAGLACGTGASFGIIAAGRTWIDQMLRSASGLGEQFSGGHLNLGRLAAIMFGIGGVGWILEGLLSAAILAFLANAMPDLLSDHEAG